MNQELIDMARQTGLGQLLDCDGVDNCVERFAALVAAAEREACAKLADEYATRGGSRFFNWLLKNFSAAIRARGETK